MKKSILIGLLAIAIVSFGFHACKNDDEGRNHNPEKVRVRYLTEEVCCGNMIILDNKTIERICIVPDDSLLRAVNLTDFAIAQTLKDGNILTIEYELTEDCTASCGIDCNRDSAIPVRLSSIE